MSGNTCEYCERAFAKNQQQWPARLPHVSRVTRNSWEDVAFRVDGNLVSCAYASTIIPGLSTIPLSRSDLKEEPRKEVGILIERLVPHTYPHNPVEDVNSRESNRNCYHPGADFYSKCWLVETPRVFSI